MRREFQCSEPSLLTLLPMISSWGLASFNNNASLLTTMNGGLTDARINKLVSWKYITGRGSREELQDQKSALVVWIMQVLDSVFPCPGVLLKIAHSLCTEPKSTEPQALGRRYWVLFCHWFLYYYYYYYCYVMEVEIHKELTGVWVTSCGLRIEWRQESDWTWPCGIGLTGLPKRWTMSFWVGL